MRKITNQKKYKIKHKKKDTKDNEYKTFLNKNTKSYFESKKYV